MTKSVTVAELTEHLAEHLAEVRDGTTIEVVDEDEVIATIAPTIYYPPPGSRLGDLTPGPRPKNLTVDPVDILLEDRHRDRYK